MILNICFLLITLLFLLFFYLGTGRNKRVLLIFIGWILVISTLAIFNFFKNTNTVPPRFALILFGNFFLILFCYQQLKFVSIEYPYAMLIHSLRIPVEIALYILFMQKEVPEIMTFKGWNYDIVIGLSAFIGFISFYYFNVKPAAKLLLYWNGLGLLFLANIVIIAVLSAPLPFQQLSFEQPNLAVIKFPFILLPSCIVPIVVLSHILAFKQLYRK